MTALGIIHHVLKRKIMINQRDHVGILLFGAEAVDENGEIVGSGNAKFSDISCMSQVWGNQVHELQTLGQPTAKRIKQIERLCHEDTNIMNGLCLKHAQNLHGSSTSAALRDGLRACLRMLEGQSRKELDSRRIWLFTNEDDPSQVNDPSQVIKDAREGGVEMWVWHFPAQDGREFNRNKFYEPLLAVPTRFVQDGYEIADEKDTGSCTKMIDAGSGDVNSLLLGARTPLFKKRRYVRTKWHISVDPPISLDVAFYKTIQRCRKPMPVKLAAVSNRRLATSTKWMSEDLVQYVDPELDVACGLEFGKGGVTIPLYSAAYEMKQRVCQRDPGLHLLAFLPAEELAWELNVTSSTLIYPEEMALKGCTRAFSALRKAMLQQHKMALVRLHINAVSYPRLAVLLAPPATPGLELIVLPFLDDLRAIESPHLESLPTLPSMDQREAAKSVISRLAMRWEEYYQGYSNPGLQKFYAGLQALALEQSDVDWNELADDRTWPDEKELLGRTGEAMRGLWESSRDPDKVLNGGSSGKRKSTVAGGNRLLSLKKEKRVVKDSGKAVKGHHDNVKSEFEAFEGAQTREGLSKLTVRKLKDLCQELGLHVSGRKNDLIDCLLSHKGSGLC